MYNLSIHPSALHSVFLAVRLIVCLLYQSGCFRRNTSIGHVDYVISSTLCRDHIHHGSPIYLGQARATSPRGAHYLTRR